VADLRVVANARGPGSGPIWRVVANGSTE
jgi:hypothetical protein